MGLFGFVKKAVGFAAKTALSKVTGGVSDKVFSALKATKAMKTMSVKKPEMKTTAAQLNEIKYSTAKLPKAKTAAAEVGAAAKKYFTQQAPARRARAARAPRPKPACKYGPRGSDGYCPKKPAAAPRAPAQTKASKRASAAAGRAAARLVPRITAARAAKAGAAARKLLPYAGVAAAGAGAYTLVRKSKVGGAAGDAIVDAHFRRQAKKDQNKINAFQAQLRAERAAGPVSSARVKAIAKSHGL